MSHLMKLAEVLRDIGEDCSKSEIEQALGLCMGFADRVSREREGAAEDPESLGQSINTNLSQITIGGRVKLVSTSDGARPPSKS